MKSTVDNLKGLSRKLNIEVPANEVSSKFEDVYSNIQKTANLKGFRKGKAPIVQIKKMYGEKVRQDVLQDLVAKFYSQAITEHKLEPISHPKIEIENFDEGDDFKFSAEIEIRPDVTLKNYEGLKVEKEKLVIPEEKVTEVLENVRSSFQETTPILEDRPAQDGDIAHISFDGKIDGEPLPGGQADDHNLEIGSNSFIPGFEEGVVGMKIGDERDVTTKFPDDYHAADIAGKEVVFKVKLKGLLKKSLPELNDELAKKLGEKFETIAELKKTIEDDLKQSEEKRIQDDLHNRVLKALVKENPVDVPEQLHQEQKKRIVDDVTGRLKQQGVDEAGLKEYTDKWDKDFDEQASNMIQSSFLVDKLSQELKLQADEKDVDKKLENQAKEMNIEIDRLKEYYNKPETRNNLKYQLTEEKVIQFILEKAEVKEVEKDKLSDQKINI